MQATIVVSWECDEHHLNVTELTYECEEGENPEECDDNCRICAYANSALEDVDICRGNVCTECGYDYCMDVTGIKHNEVLRIVTEPSDDSDNENLPEATVGNITDNARVNMTIEWECMKGHVNETPATYPDKFIREDIKGCSGDTCEICRFATFLFRNPLCIKNDPCKTCGPWKDLPDGVYSRELKKITHTML